jgi:quercetin dioxygenase-like cupin family protein
MSCKSPIDCISEEKKRLKKLEELTEKLPTFHDIIKEKTINSYLEMEMDEGYGFGFNLWNQEEIAVARWFSTKGSKFPKHSHLETEWIIVYKGKMRLIFNDKEVILNEGEGYQIEPNIDHGAEFLDNTWYIAMTIPASKDWPK